MSSIFSCRIPVGFGWLRILGSLSWCCPGKATFQELLGKTEEERLGWRWRMPRGSFQQMRKCVSRWGRGPWRKQAVDEAVSGTRQQKKKNEKQILAGEGFCVFLKCKWHSQNCLIVKMKDLKKKSKAKGMETGWGLILDWMGQLWGAGAGDCWGSSSNQPPAFKGSLGVQGHFLSIHLILNPQPLTSFWLSISGGDTFHTVGGCLALGAVFFHRPLLETLPSWEYGPMASTQ